MSTAALSMSTNGTPAPTRPDTLRLLTAFGSPIALGTTLMVYFGWVRSEAQARAFGADASVFEMSAQELVLRSVDILFLPVILLLLLTSLALRLDPWLCGHARRIAPVLRFAWILVPLGLGVRAVTDQFGDLILPMFVFLAIGGTAYAGLLRRRAGGHDHAPRFAQVVVVVLLLVVVLFWQTERWAQLSGRALAADRRERDRRDPARGARWRLHIPLRRPLPAPTLRRQVLPPERRLVHRRRPPDHRARQRCGPSGLRLLAQLTATADTVAEATSARVLAVQPAGWWPTFGRFLTSHPSAYKIVV